MLGEWHLVMVLQVPHAHAVTGVCIGGRALANNVNVSWHSVLSMFGFCCTSKGMSAVGTITVAVALLPQTVSQFTQTYPSRGRS